MKTDKKFYGMHKVGSAKKFNFLAPKEIQSIPRTKGYMCMGMPLAPKVKPVKYVWGVEVQDYILNTGERVSLITKLC